MQLQVQSSLIEEIQKRHSESESLNPQFELLIIRKANLMRECGLYLQELRDQAPHGTWLDLFATNSGKVCANAQFDFDRSTASRYMKFAANNEQPFTDIETAKRAMAAAWKTQHAIDSGGHGPQGEHGTTANFFVTAGKQLQSFAAHFEKQMTTHPVEQWAPETAEQFVFQMEPVLERVNGIYAQAKARALAITDRAA